MQNFQKRASLLLENGSIFNGYSFGYEKYASGEVVFNTGMVGYPETLTDPSYKGQILVLTYPLIGNYGIPKKVIENTIEKYFESNSVQISGLVVTYYSDQYSHWNASQSLSEWLISHKIPAIFGVDTRELTKLLRSSGTMLGSLNYEGERVQKEFYDPNNDILVDQVSTKEVVEYGEGEKTVVLVDCGTKNNIIRSLIKRNIKVIRVPWDYDFSTLKYDGILLSNGPGNPSNCLKTIENTKKAFKKNVPILGICLGSQIMGIAIGAEPYKLKYGHRGLNQPCFEVETKRCYITSQNHGICN